MMLLPLLLKEKGKGIMLVGQVVQAVLAATLVLLQVFLIAIVPLLLDQMQGIHLELEWIQLRTYLNRILIHVDTDLEFLKEAHSAYSHGGVGELLNLKMRLYQVAKGV